MNSLFVHTESNINLKASIVTVTVTCRTATEAFFLNSLLLMVQIDSLSCSFTYTCPFLLNVEFFVRKWPFSGEDDRGKTSPRALVFTRCDIQSERL